MKKVYLSGQITGLSESEFTENFHRAAELVEGMGHQPINPLDVLACADRSCGSNKTFDNGDYQHTWDCYMRHDIKAMMDCQLVVMLPNFWKSKGALTEKRIAEEMGIDVVYLDGDWVTIIGKAEQL